jgi:hypothetical protein
MLSLLGGKTPLLSRGGVAEGRGGAGRELIYLTSTTPSARKQCCFAALLDRAAFPSSAEEGSSGAILQPETLPEDKRLRLPVATRL